MNLYITEPIQWERQKITSKSHPIVQAHYTISTEEALFIKKVQDGEIKIWFWTPEGRRFAEINTKNRTQ